MKAIAVISRARIAVQLAAPVLHSIPHQFCAILHFIQFDQRLSFVGINKPNVPCLQAHGTSRWLLPLRDIVRGPPKPRYREGLRARFVQGDLPASSWNCILAGGFSYDRNELLHFCPASQHKVLTHFSSIISYPKYSEHMSWHCLLSIL